MPTIQRILQLTDFSEQSAAAAEYGSFLASLCDAELHLLDVVELEKRMVNEYELEVACFSMEIGSHPDVP